MTYTLSRSMIFQASPERIFDELLDIPSHMTWGDMTGLELLFEGAPQVGSRWYSVGETGGVQMKDECTLTELERPVRFSFQSKSQNEMGSMLVHMSYDLEPLPEGTRVTFSRWFEELALDLPLGYRLLLALPGAQRTLDSLMIGKVIVRGLARLRERVEKTGA